MQLTKQVSVNSFKHQNIGQHHTLPNGSLFSFHSLTKTQLRWEERRGHRGVLLLTE